VVLVEVNANPTQFSSFRRWS